MGTKGIDIVEIDVKEVIGLLNKALADEWLAYYQYWLGAKVVSGKMAKAVVPELVEHANDELRHAGMLVDRILALGGTPILNPAEWMKASNCGYDAPEDTDAIKILEQNVKGEQCAIDVYNKLAKMTLNKDVLTYNIAVEILGDEVEHEDDLQTLLEDILQK